MSLVRRLNWWAELPLLIVVYALYSAGRLVISGDSSEATAVDNGLAILHFEESLHLNAEHPLNRLFTSEAWLGIPADFAYASLHYLVTPAVLIWLWTRRSAEYRVMRTWLMLSTVIGLIGFTLVPTCPPRLLDATHGFTDTMAQYGDYGWWSTEASAPEGLGSLTNQFAAMPSLHVGWALWCGVVLWRYGRRVPWLRTLAVAYPLSTALVVMGTANHYLLDAVAGAAVMGLGLLLTRPALHWADGLRLRCAPAALRLRTRLAAWFPARAGTTPGSRPVRSAVVRRGSADVSAGCQTSARTAYSGEAREAKGDDDIPRQRQHSAASTTGSIGRRDGRGGRGGRGGTGPRGTTGRTGPPGTASATGATGATGTAGTAGRTSGTDTVGGGAADGTADAPEPAAH